MAKVPSHAARTVVPGDVVPETGTYKSSHRGEIAVLIEDEIAPPTPLKDEVWVLAYDMN